LANWRKSSKAITEGKLMQFVPEKSLYVYFRYISTEKVMVILNAANDAQTLDLQRFDEMIQGKSTGKEISSGASVDLTKPLRLDAWSVQVIEIK
jgi:neopullulanase